MHARLEGRAIVVTGAGSGVGRAIALKFAAEGAAVGAIDVDAKALDELLVQLRERGQHGGAAVADIGDAAQVREAVRRLHGALGRIDGLVNNAGVFGTPDPLLEMSEATWRRVMDINLEGTYRATREVLPFILEAGGGTVVNIASTASFIVGGGGAAYTTSKHAVLGFTRQLAHDYARRNVRVNAICPGAIDTALTRPIWEQHPEALQAYSSVPAGRIGRPEEVADLALFLSGAESTFIHGTSVVIDGGLMLT